jgi:hypothetical protein
MIGAMQRVCCSGDRSALLEDSVDADAMGCSVAYGWKWVVADGAA